jgi:hypothetical protein
MFLASKERKETFCTKIIGAEDPLYSTTNIYVNMLLGKRQTDNNINISPVADPGLL